RKDLGAWSVPKGELEAGEDELAGAVREFEEETGYRPSGPFVQLPVIKQAGGKVVHAWAVEGDLAAGTVRSNTFALEWPPRSGRMQDFPEIDRTQWFTMAEARERILKSQLPLLDA